MSLREHVSLREHACVSSRGAQSTELVWILDFKQILFIIIIIKRCDGTIQEADLAGNLMVDGETYGSGKSFSYLGDTIDGDGGCPLCQK